MNDDIALLLNSSLYVKRDYLKRRKISIQWGSQRIKQHILGIQALENLKVFDLFRNVIYTDNTFNNKNKLPNEILEILPSHTIYNLRKNNTYGKKNKGAGLVENLISCKNDIEKFKHIVYFEPKLYLKDVSFFNEFVKDPKNTFFSQEGYLLYRTGHFGVESDLLMKFLHLQDLDHLIENQITIEYEFYNFFSSYNPHEISSSISKRNTGYRYKLDINDIKTYEDY